MTMNDHHGMRVSFLTNISIALCRSIELPNSFNVETAFEFIPDLWPQSVAKGNRDSMLVLLWFVRLSQQISGQLTDVLGDLEQRNQLTHWSLRDFNEILDKYILWHSPQIYATEPYLWSQHWCRQAASHYLGQCWSTFMSPYGIIRPKWV